MSSHSSSFVAAVAGHVASGPEADLPLLLELLICLPLQASLLFRCSLRGCTRVLELQLPL